VLAAAQRVLLTEGVDAVTLQRVAAAGGIGRRTVYRHWPDRLALLRDTMAMTRAPELDEDAAFDAAAAAHLRAFASALVDGPLGVVMSVLHERGAHDPSMDALRQELVDAGCAPLRRRLQRAVQEGELPTELDVDAAVERLEGPVLHRALLRRTRVDDREIEGIVSALRRVPPLRGGSGRP
jgi:AcrR family transcriptional regulator